MYLILDTETGGLDPQVNPLLQVYFSVRDAQLKEVDRLNVLRNTNSLPAHFRRMGDPCFDIDPKAMAINKINLEEHNKLALPEDICHTYLRTLLHTSTERYNNKLTPVGWNIHFDINMIYAQLMGREEWLKYNDYRVLDVASLVKFGQLKKKLPPEITSLAKAAKFFGIDTTGNHEAKKDVEITAQVLRSLIFFI